MSISSVPCNKSVGFAIATPLDYLQGSIVLRSPVDCQGGDEFRFRSSSWFLEPFRIAVYVLSIEEGAERMNFIDEAVERFAHDHTKPESDLYLRLRDETYATMKSPGMQVGRI